MFIFLLGLAGGLIFCILFVGYRSVPEMSTLFVFFLFFPYGLLVYCLCYVWIKHLNLLD